MGDETGQDGGPVTASITQRVEPGCEQAYEALLAAIHEEVKAFGGFLRREVIKATDGPLLEYTIVLHFDSEASLRRWERSPERDRWWSRMASLAAETTPLQVLTGLETWFTVSAGQAIVPPPRVKMTLVTGLALFPLIALLNAGFAALPEAPPLVLRAFLATVILVPLMTYVVMPRMTRLFQPWLYPRASGK